MKKTISVLLACILLLGVMAPVALAAKVTRVSTPIVFVGGQEDYIYSDKDNKKSAKYNTGELSEEALGDISDSIRTELFRAISFGNWKPYTDGFYEAAMPYYDGVALNNKGLPTNKTGYDCLKEKTVVDKAVNGRYGLYDYQFIYDWRLDPISNATDLNTYINQVLTATGKTKVDIVAQGIGCSTVLAYLSKYGSTKVSELVLDNAALRGSEDYGAMFSNDIEQDPDRLAVFLAESRRNNALLQVVKQNIDPENWESMSSVKATRATYGKLYEDVIPRIMRNVFGTMPGIWSLIPDAYYNAAIDSVFPKYELAEDQEGFSAKEYKVLIDKINNYHSTIALKTDKILSDAKKAGVNVYLIANYGFQMIPVSASSGQSDVYVSIGSQTLGATAAKYGETFSKNYLKLADAAYISPDNEIDSSTGAYADHTWFIKNLEYREKPETVDALIIAILNFNGYTSVIDLEDYPQFLYCSNDRLDLAPLTEEGDSDYEETEQEESTSGKLTLSNFFEFVKNFIEAIVRLVTSLIHTGQNIEIGEPTTTPAVEPTSNAG